MNDRIRNLTANIVSAHIANNDVSAEQLPSLIESVHQVLVSIGQTPVEPPKAKSFVETTESVFADHIICLTCGGGFKVLMKHLRSTHRMTPAEYRIKWGLAPSYPMVAANYVRRRSIIALASGPGLKPWRRSKHSKRSETHR
jgi:predicted transcriptional regulator